MFLYNKLKLIIEEQFNTDMGKKGKKNKQQDQEPQEQKEPQQPQEQNQIQENIIEENKIEENKIEENKIEENQIVPAQSQNLITTIATPDEAATEYQLNKILDQLKEAQVNFGPLEKD